jgi:hypothetical protein
MIALDNVVELRIGYHGNMARTVSINGREFSDSLAVRLAPHITEDRAWLIAALRRDREFTWRAVSGECGRLWQKDWGYDQAVGETLCRLAAAKLGIDNLDHLE